MTAKKIVQDFYKSDVLLDSEKVKAFLHPDVVLEWHSSKGFHKLNYDQIIDLSNELGKAYSRSKNRISHLLVKDNMVSLRYQHYIKTIENPREEMLLANFMVLWELKDNLLHRGYQMSQV